MRKSTWQYYSVKLIYQAIIVGDPLLERVDGDYSDTHTFFEESIVLIHAQSFDHAYTLAEKHAVHHVRKYRNQYGQTVEWKLVDAINCFLIDDELENGIELYSSITPVEKETMSDQYLMQKYQYNLNDYDWNDMHRQRRIHLQRVLTYEEFSKWRSSE